MPDQSSNSPHLGHQKPKKHGSKHQPPKVVVVSEGGTEIDYMDGFSRIYQRKFVYEPYERETFDRDLTDKSELLNLLEAQIRYMQGHVTPFCYAT